MLLKYPIIFIIFLLLAILQFSFFPFFAIMGAVPNLIFILFFCLIFLEKDTSRLYGFFVTILTGFILDLFVHSSFGFHILTFMAVYYIYLGFRYLLHQRQNKINIFYFLLLLLICFLITLVIEYLISKIIRLDAGIGFKNIIEIAYSIPFAIVGFFVSKKIDKFDNSEKQLKLL